MIFEAIRHILTPAPKEVRALGYVREAIAIEARYARHHTAWASHLARCRLNILAAARYLPPASTIMIIGSGALHDVPVEDLLSAGFHLALVDIVHLPETRRRYRNHDRICFIEQDVTGLVNNLYWQKNIKKTAFALPKADLIISLNILSQLPVMMTKYAAGHNISLPDDFARDIMSDHLALLGPEAVLISDLDRRYEKDGVPLETESALPALGLPDPIDEWDWHIAPRGELDKDISLAHHVACWQI